MTVTNPLRWTSTAEGAPAIQVDGVAKAAEITVEARASLAELQWTWTIPASPTGGEALVIPLDIPAKAWLHPAAEDYLTDLRVQVTIDGMRWLRTGFLVWPSGVRGAPVVWTREQARALAPQGVLDPRLRVPDAGPDDRLMPDVSDVLALPATNISMKDGEVEP